MRALYGVSGIYCTIATRSSVTGFDQLFAREESNHCGFRRVLQI